MRVLHVTSNVDPLSGGPARALHGLALSQKRAGIDCRVISTWQDELDQTLVKEMRAAGIEVTLIGPCREPLKRHPDLRAAMKAAVGNADLLHIHALWEEVQHVAASEARSRRLPYLFRPCGMLDPWSLSQGRLKKQFYMLWRLRSHLNHAAAIHYTAADEQAAAAPLRLKAPGLVIPNGLDLEEFRDLPARGTFRRSDERLGDRPLLLALSRIHQKKGFDILIPAFAKCETPGAVLVIAGPDDVGYTPQVVAMAKLHGVLDRIVFTGLLDSRRRIEALVDADLLVLPSYQENFGVAVVEAAAAGLPVVISDRVAIHQEISDAGAGAVVGLDADQLAATLRTWLADGSRREAASRKARPYAFENYDWNRIAERWKLEYRRFMDAGRSA